jgi:hypothetical protein
MGHDAGLDIMLNKQPQKVECDVGNNLEVDRAVVAHPHPLNRIDIHHLPEGIEFIVPIDPINNLLKPGIVSGWNPDQDLFCSRLRFLDILWSPHSRFNVVDLLFFIHDQSYLSYLPKKGMKVSVQG